MTPADCGSARHWGILSLIRETVAYNVADRGRRKRGGRLRGGGCDNDPGVPSFGLGVSLGDNLTIGCIFTIVSLVRGSMLLRLFDRPC